METSQDPTVETATTEAVEKTVESEPGSTAVVPTNTSNVHTTGDTMSDSSLAPGPTSHSQDASSTSAGEEIVITLRNPTERPVYKVSIKLIETYKHINKVYYEAKAKRLKEQKDTGSRTGVHNDGYDDANYDYILGTDEIFADRYIIKHKMGKGSFGQVVCAYDQVLKCEVAVKIIKSRKPFLVQAQTEIELLNKILEQDEKDECNVVRLLNHFVYRNHQCLVFEILSFNLYELLKNTKFRGVSLNLTRKFSRYLLVALELLASPPVNIIHCDLKPENILLRHPRRSAIKLIDFGSSCYLTKRTYSYIQSRFYRSPEVLLGLPYTQKIDMWSLGCVAVEMHTGEPLFGGLNQADQICRMVDILGMPPLDMILRSPEKVRTQFFERVKSTKSDSPETSGSDAGNTKVKDAEKSDKQTPSSQCDMNHIVYEEDQTSYFVLKRPTKGDQPKPRTLTEILGVHSGGPSGRRAGEDDHTPEKYLEFLDFIQKLLVYSPEERANPTDMLVHPYILNSETASGALASSTAATGAGSQTATTTETAAAVTSSTANDAGDAAATSQSNDTSVSAPVTGSTDLNATSALAAAATATTASVSGVATTALTTSSGTAAAQVDAFAGDGGSGEAAAPPAAEEEEGVQITPLPDINNTAKNEDTVNANALSSDYQVSMAKSAAASSSATTGVGALPKIRSKSAPGER